MIKELIFDGITAKAIVNDEHEHQQKYWMKGKYYETQRNGLLNYIYANEPKGGKYIDIGASIGNHSIFFGVVMQAKELHSIEPNFNSYNHLVENMKLNGLYNDHTTTRRIAIGEIESICSMRYIAENNVGMSIVTSGFDTPIRPIDTLDFFEGYDVIKIDVENFNKELITGALETFKKGTGNIYIEADTTKERNMTDDLMALCDYERVENLVFNATPTYLYKKI